jgi:hypothetical protein
MTSDAAERWISGLPGRSFASPTRIRETALRARSWVRLTAHLPPDASGAWLVYEEEGRGCAVALTGPVVVGRGEDADVRPGCSWLSRRHFRVYRDGGWAVEVLGGRNALHLNGERMAGPRPLVSGDLLRVADFDLLFFEAP